MNHKKRKERTQNFDTAVILKSPGQNLVKVNDE
jgi:hypothetical protein